MNKPKNGLFVTGTDTEVGKTYVTSLLGKSLVAKGQRVGVYKPVASGCIRRDGVLVSEDAEKLWHSVGRPQTMAEVTPQCFEAAVAPNVAARAEGKRVDGQQLRAGLAAWSDSEFVLVEGVGGLMSPISDEDLVVDLAVELGYPLVIVVPNVLGCINQTLQTLMVSKQFGLEVAGIVLNDVSPTSDASAASNLSELDRLASAPILARAKFGATEIDTVFCDRLM